MPQHDYDIANAAGATFRADINSMAAAIVQTNAGSSAPSAMFANMEWYDQTAGLLKQRDPTNALWNTQRTSIASGTIFYVASVGADTNNGLTSAAAFKTIQAAISRVARYVDTGNGPVTIQVIDGLYSESLSLKSLLGDGNITLQGNTTNPLSCVVVSSRTGAIIDATRCHGTWAVQGFTVTNCGGIGISANGCNLNLGVMNFGVAQNAAHITADRNATILMQSNYTITGSAASHAFVQAGGRISMAGLTVTMSGNPGFSSAYIVAINLAVAQAVGLTTVNSGNGRRFFVAGNSVIDCGNAGINVLPGTVAGTQQSGGILL